MRVVCLLFAAVVIVVESISSISGAKVADRENLILADTVVPSNGHARRFLRTTKTFKDDIGDDEDRAGVLDFVKTASLPTLDNLAVELSTVPGAVKFMKDHVTKRMKQIASRKWTPESLAEKLNIASKRETMSETELLRDPDYLLWEHFIKFWNQRKAQV